MPLIDDNNRRVTVPKKKKKKRTTNPRGGSGSNGGQADRSSSRSKNWRKIILGGKAVRISQNYGNRNSGYSLGYHTGTDIGVASGTSVYMPEGGKVVSSGWGGAYGYTVVVKTKSGYYIRFAHMSKLSVSRGDTIKAGQYVGKSGNTGNSRGAHLHLEVMKPSSGGRFGAGNFVDPVNYLNTHSSATGTTGGGGGSGGSGGGGGGGGSSSTTTVIGGGGGGSTKVAFSKKEFYAALEAKFGSIDTLLALDKEAKLEGGKSIKWAIDEMVKKKVTDPSIALTYLNKTAWFRKYSEQITQRLVMEKSKKELAAREIKAKRSEIESFLNQTGVKLSDAGMQTMARNAWVFDWSNETLIDEIQKNGKATYEGGNIAAGLDTLEQYADDYGVSLSDAEIRQFRQDFLDNKGDQALRDTIQKRAAMTYKVFEKELLEGRSLKSMTGAYFDKAAQLLEVDPNTIDWEDPLFRGGKAFTQIDPKTGQPLIKPLWEFEKEIRKDSRWQQTDNAREAVMGTTGGILKQMGLI